MKSFFISIFLALFFVFPSITTDNIHIEYNRLKQYYPKLTFTRMKIIYIYSNIHDLETDMVCGLINEESNWSSTALSKVYARGLMQVMAKYHYKNRNPNDLFEDELNISKGTKILRDNINFAKKLYGKNYLPESFRFYNAGTARPHERRKKYKNWDYVKEIIKNMENTKKLKYNIII